MPFAAGALLNDRTVTGATPEATAARPSPADLEPPAHSDLLDELERLAEATDNAFNMTRGGYVLAVVVYVLNRGEYHPLMRPALLASAFAYTLANLAAFVDIDPVTFNIDPARVEDGIGSKTKALLPVHLFGQSAEMDALLEIGRRRELPVIEDAAQALGATYRSGEASRPAHCTVC